MSFGMASISITLSDLEGNFSCLKPSCLPYLRKCSIYQLRYINNGIRKRTSYIKPCIDAERLFKVTGSRIRSESSNVSGMVRSNRLLRVSHMWPIEWPWVTLKVNSLLASLLTYIHPQADRGDASVQWSIYIVNKFLFFKKITIVYCILT